MMNNSIKVSFWAMITNTHILNGNPVMKEC